MSQPRWEICLGSEFVDYDLESQQRLERAMQAGEVELQLLLVLLHHFHLRYAERVRTVDG